MPRGARRVAWQTIRLHGHDIAYRRAGHGPAVILLHGIAESSQVWERIIPLLATRHTVIAPDLLGHGRSDKPKGDYSLASQANLIRDIQVALGLPSATLVGHSLGGGIAMQFAYQFPERCDRLVLIASGGLGSDVTFLLRSLGLPGADLVAPLVLSGWVRDRIVDAGSWLARRGLRLSSGQRALWESYAGLTDPNTRRAFIATGHSVIDHQGQRVSAMDRLYLAEQLPVLVMWGGRDRIIPVSHAHAAQEAMPHATLEILDDAGHFLPAEQPEKVALRILDFIAGTKPGRRDLRQLRAAIRRGPREKAVSR
jgi:pimeloyl-ACP methyl ester carboxylesterase